MLVRTLTTAYEALAEMNPFRYRGYVWDEETELDYLRSRYYGTSKTEYDTLHIQHKAYWILMEMSCAWEPERSD